MNLDNENIKRIKEILREIELINLTINEVKAVENDSCKLEFKAKMTYIQLEEDEKKELASALGEYVDHSTTDWSE